MEQNIGCRALSSQMKISIVGGGIASFATGIYLRELFPHAKLDLYTNVTQDKLGGHLVSWNEGGYHLEHGFHALFGFYEQAQELLTRTGAMRNFVRSPNYYHTYRNNKLYRTEPFNLFSNPGFSARERLELSRFYVNVTKLAAEITLKGTEALKQYDNEDFRHWSLRMGVPKSIVFSSFYDQLYAGPFNDPFEMSAFVALESLYGCITKPWQYYFKKPSKEAVIIPLADYFKNECSGTIHYEHKLLRLNPSLNESNEINSLTFKHRGTEASVSSDYFVLALGAEDFKNLDCGKLSKTHPYFTNIHKLSTVSSISLQMWFKHDPVPTKLRTMVGGFAKPFVVLCPLSKIRGEPAHPKHPHEIISVGAEADYEHIDDQTLINRHMDDLRTAGFKFSGDLREGKDAHYYLRRNQEPGHRYLLTRPNEWSLRPQTQSPYRNVVLAGAWLQNKWSLPCVEAAICSSKNAAKTIKENFLHLKSQEFIPQSIHYLPETLVLPPPYFFPKSTGHFFILDRNQDFNYMPSSSLQKEFNLDVRFKDKIIVCAFKHENVSSFYDPSKTKYNYDEIMIALLVRSKNDKKPGLLPISLYLNDSTAIAAGREVYGFPKKQAQVLLTTHGKEYSLQVLREGTMEIGQTMNSEKIKLINAHWKGSEGTKKLIANSISTGLKQVAALVNGLPEISIYTQTKIFDSRRDELQKNVPPSLLFSKSIRTTMKNFKIESFEPLSDVKFNFNSTLQDPLPQWFKTKNQSAKTNYGLKLEFSMEL